MAYNASNESYSNESYSNESYSNDTTTGQAVYDEEPHQLTTFRRIIFSLVILGALFGNAIVIRAVRSGRSRKPFTHYLVTNLAVAELLNSFFLVFLFAQEEMYYWAFGSFVCHLIIPGTVITFGVTTATLACISLYRFRVLVTPYKKSPSRRACMIVITVIWLYSFAFSMPVILTTQIHVHYGYDYCLPDKLPTYSLVRVICQFFIPVIVMLVSYSFASVTIKEHVTFMENRRQDRQNSNISSLNTYLDSQANSGAPDANFLMVPIPHAQPEIPVQTLITPRESVSHGRKASEVCANSSFNQNGEDGHMIETERDVIKMFYVIVLVFVFCYLPWQLFFMLNHFSVIQPTVRHYNIVRSITFLLISFPSALHPLCYGTMSRFYAKAFSKIILCKCKK